MHGIRLIPGRVLGHDTCPPHQAVDGGVIDVEAAHCHVIAGSGADGVVRVPHAQVHELRGCAFDPNPSCRIPELCMFDDPRASAHELNAIPPRLRRHAVALVVVRVTTMTVVTVVSEHHRLRVGALHVQRTLDDQAEGRDRHRIGARELDHDPLAYRQRRSSLDDNVPTDNARTAAPNSIRPDRPRDCLAFCARLSIAAGTCRVRGAGFPIRAGLSGARVTALNDKALQDEQCDTQPRWARWQ